MSSKNSGIVEYLDKILFDSLPYDDQMAIRDLMEQGYTLVEALEALDLI